MIGDTMMAGINNTIRIEYEKRRREALRLLEHRKEEVFEKIPEIVKIHNKINSLGLRYNKMILLGRCSSEKASAELSVKLQKLIKKKENLLIEAGYPTTYLDPVYKCHECKDTGFIEEDGVTEKCFCYKQLLIDQLYNQSNLNLVQTENFSTFNENYYTEKVDEERYGIKKSPREQILGIKEKCQEFINNFDSVEEKNLFFCGPAGVGKTFMANCIAYELMNRGRTVLYQSAPILFDTIAEYKIRNYREKEWEDSYYKNIFNVDLLIIDDLGTETQTPSRYAELLNILNIRQTNNYTSPCKTIISSNIEINKIYEYYTERVASRIIGSFAIYRFAGEDIRRIKKLAL
jgi:DNA replication protein DnaC